MQLYSFFNSSTSYRLRIALALKGLPYDYEGVNIRNGEHRAADYVENINPSACVPAFVDGEMRLGQSLAIVDYLDLRYPGPQLIPSDPVLRARVLEMSYVIACDMHPLNNMRILKQLEKLGLSAEQRSDWYKQWVDDGFAVIERLLKRYGSSPYCFGTEPTLADCCLVPQVANAMRMGCDTSAFPVLMAAYTHAIGQPAFQAAEPQRQPDVL